MRTTRSLGVFDVFSIKCVSKGGPGAGRARAPVVSNASHIPDHFSLSNMTELYFVFTREDKGDREGIPHIHPYSIGNSSRLIFKTTDPKGD